MFTQAKRFASKLTHVAQNGELNMVNVYKKTPTHRTSVSSCIVHLGPEAYKQVHENTLKKGDVISVAKIAGIQASKKTSDLIPLCHNISLDATRIDITGNPKNHTMKIVARVSVTDKTGCEMESMTAASVAALTVYDMCKAVTKDIRITDLQLESKTGGKSGVFHRSG